MTRAYITQNITANAAFVAAFLPVALIPIDKVIVRALLTLIGAL